MSEFIEKILHKQVGIKTKRHKAVWNDEYLANVVESMQN